MRIIQQPKIAVNVFPDEIPSEKNCRLTDIWSNKIVFDSDRLEHDPRPQFKYLSIGDFDLYTATAFLLANNTLHPGYMKTEIECNRINKTFRMRLIGLQDGMSYAELKKNGNILELELLFNVLDNIFGLVNPIEMTQADFGHTSYRIEDMLSYAFRVHRAHAKKYSIFEPEIGREVAGEDVALILRKMLPSTTHTYDNWIRSFRGRRMFVTHEHPELLM